MTKINTVQQRSKKRNFLPSTSGVEPLEDPLKLNERSLRLNPGHSMLSNQSSFGPQKEQVGQTLHGRLKDIKEQLHPLLDGKKELSHEKRYQSKFRRAGAVQSYGVYDQKGQMGLD